MSKQTYEKMEKFKIKLVVRFGFFATLLLNLEIKENNKLTDTCSTDGKQLIYNEKFVDSISYQELNFVMMHEVMHCALGHLWRRGSKDFETWNIACDFAVNWLLYDIIYNMKAEHAADFKMLRGCLFDENFKNMSAEEIYNIIIKYDKKKKPQQKSDHSQWEEEDCKPDNIKNQKVLDWDLKMINSNDMMTSCGILSGGMERYVKNITHPQKNWRLLLQDFIQKDINDFSLLPPDKRYDDDFLMFDFNECTEKVEDIYFFVDTSGSMSADDISACYSEIQGAINQFKNQLHGKLCFFDAKVDNDVYDFDDVGYDIRKIIPIGGGGTDFSIVFDYVNDKKVDNVNGIIMLTDGKCDYPDESVTNGIPVLWIYTDKDGKAPFGASAYLDVNV